MKLIASQTLPVEVEYARRQQGQRAWLVGHGYDNSVWPTGSSAQTSAQDIGTLVTQEWIAQPTLVADFQAEIDRHQTVLDAFFGLFSGAFAPPTQIYIHLTKYGPGGSYIPATTPIVAVRQDQPNLLATAVHECIHSLIEGPLIQRYAICHRLKEGIVDFLCTCKELEPICGGYQLQEFAYRPYRSILDRIEWTRRPTWNVARRWDRLVWHCRHPLTPCRPCP